MTNKIDKISDLKIELRNTKQTDLEKLFVIQLDKEANYLAAFASKDPTNKNEYKKKWTRLLTNPTVNMRTIIVNNKIAGSVVKFEMDGKAEITYWIEKQFWGKGITTTALEKFMEIENIRPIYGRVAFDNYGSQRVLEKCGFKNIGKEKGYANARNKEIEEFIYKLDY